jgi:hypothetical protein
MKTATKIGIATALHEVVRFGRGLAGLPDKGIFSRRGITYDLDLAQGIDFAIYLGGMFERTTAVALAGLTEPSSLVLDIGANIGAHTLLLASLVGPNGRVMAFEPTDFAFRKLRRNLDLNPQLASRVETLRCFLTANDGTSIPSAIYSSWPLAIVLVPPERGILMFYAEPLWPIRWRGRGGIVGQLKDDSFERKKPV